MRERGARTCPHCAVAEPEPANEWAGHAAQARLYLAAGAWQSAHDLLWPVLQQHWADRELPFEATESLCLLLSACSRLNHSEHLSQGNRRLHALDLSSPALGSMTRVLAALNLAQEETTQGRYDAALEHLEHIPEACLGDVEPGTRARVNLLAGRIEAILGHTAEAERQGLEAARLAELAGSEYLQGDAFALLAIVARRRGSLAEANTLYAKAAGHHWHAGNLSGHTIVILNRAWAVGLIGLLPQSTRLFEEALSNALALGRRTTALLARLGLGWVGLRGGQLDAARARLLAVWRDARRLGLPREEALALEYLAELYTLHGELAKARVALRRGMRLAQGLAPQGDLALEMQIRQAMLALAEGHEGEAIRIAREAITWARQAELRWEEAQSHRVLGMALHRAGRIAEARQALESALGHLSAMGEMIERGLVEAWLVALGDTGREVAPAGSARDGLPEALHFWLNHPLLVAPAAQSRQVGCGDDREGAAPRVASGATLHPVWEQVGLVTCSPALRDAVRLVETYAPSMLPVLILGETGTGKDLIARGLHALSGRPGPLVPVNCAAARKDLFVAELFGARRGAYTGAVEHRRGLIEEAAHGTIFLDEIADLEPEAQGFLLRFLDTGEVRPLGETKSRHIATRVVAATCRDLSERITEGAFRPDLYGRLAGLVVRIPPLRDRLEDLTAMIPALWQREGGSPGECREVFTAEVLAALRACAWPGNVRELRHTVSRALLFRRTHGIAAARASVCAADPVPARGKAIALAAPAPLSHGRGEWDPEFLRATLAAAGGRVSVAARALGISRSHAYRLYRGIAAKAH